jgi:peptidyl-prolyl cis-trans isomerase C
MRRLIALSLAFVALSGEAPSGALADGKTEVVVTVGNTSLTVAEVERRIRSLPSFQQASFGKTPQEIRKNFVEKVLVPELLYSEEASRRKLDQTPVVRDRIRDTLRQALEAKLKDTATDVTPEEIQAYYDANKHRFNTPRRIKIWRILVKDEALAKKIVAEVKGNDLKGAPSWTKYARENSIDKATNMRDGDLGFVSPDGQTEMPQVRVDPALFNAADKVKDGEVVPEPVKEGDGFAVIWRRGSLEAANRTLAQEAPAIKQIVGRQKVSDSIGDLAQKLQQEQVKNVNYELLNYVQVDSSGDVGTRQKPGVLPRHRARGPATPQKDERGLR